jgi:hypothetical protein
MNPVDVVDSKTAKGRNGSNAASTSMVQLDDKSQSRKRRRLERSVSIDLRRVKFELVNDGVQVETHLDSMKWVILMFNK